jgi:hypothetical protein
MGALENHIENLGRFAGFYKGIQSAGSAGSWAVCITSHIWIERMLS